MILFVCSQAFIRSKTAAVCATLGGSLDAECVGTDKSALFQASESCVYSASAIYCMEREHKDKLVKMFPHIKEKCIVLGISDDYERFNTDLVDSIVSKIYQFDEVLSEQIKQGSEIMYERFPHYRKSSENGQLFSESSMKMF